VYQNDTVIMDRKEFIERSEALYGDQFCYDDIFLGSVGDTVRLTCKRCGYRYSISPKQHLYGRGCEYCRFETAQNLLKKALKTIKKNFGDTLDYDHLFLDGEYVTIECKNCHHDIKMRPTEFAQLKKCKFC
jgi:hypothetical protein